MHKYINAKQIKTILKQRNSIIKQFNCIIKRYQRCNKKALIWSADKSQSPTKGPKTIGGAYFR